MLRVGRSAGAEQSGGGMNPFGNMGNMLEQVKKAQQVREKAVTRG